MFIAVEAAEKSVCCATCEDGATLRLVVGDADDVPLHLAYYCVGCAEGAVERWHNRLIDRSFEWN